MRKLALLVVAIVSAAVVASPIAASESKTTVNVQLKEEIRPRSKTSEPADLKRVVKILRDINYQGYVALEYESKEDPWTAVPRLLKRVKELFAA